MKFNRILALAVPAILFAQESTIRLTQSEAIRAAKERPAPDYPPMARQLHLEGEVQVQAHISESGVVEDARPLTGNAVPRHRRSQCDEALEVLSHHERGQTAKGRR